MTDVKSEILKNSVATQKSGLAFAGNDDYVLVRKSALAPTGGPRRLSSPDAQVIADKKEKKEEEGKTMILLTRPTGPLKKKGFHYSTVLNYGGTINANSANPKYLVQWPGGTAQLKVDQVTNAGEWTSFNAVFEEFFCEKMKITYIPLNKYLAYVGATNVCNSLVTVAGYQHDQAAVTDASSNFYQMMNSSESRVFSTADKFKFTWKNIEKFSWQMPANNVSGSQGWMNIADVSNYGGYVSAALNFATAASSSSTAYLQGQILGSVLVEFHMHFRYRD